MTVNSNSMKTVFTQFAARRKQHTSRTLPQWSIGERAHGVCPNCFINQQCLFFTWGWLCDIRFDGFPLSSSVLNTTIARLAVYAARIQRPIWTLFVEAISILSPRYPFTSLLILKLHASVRHVLCTTVSCFVYNFTSCKFYLFSFSYTVRCLYSTGRGRTRGVWLLGAGVLSLTRVDGLQWRWPRKSRGSGSRRVCLTRLSVFFSGLQKGTRAAAKLCRRKTSIYMGHVLGAVHAGTPPQITKWL